MPPKLRIPILLALVAAITGPAGASEPVATEPLFLHRVQVTGHDEALRLGRLGFDIAGGDPKHGLVDVVGGTGTLGELAAFGFDAARDPEPLNGPDTITALSDYLSPAEVDARLDQYQATYPSLASKRTYGTTVEGRPVRALKISDNVGTEEDEPAIFFVAQHHAREVMTPEIALDIVDVLLTGYGVDPKITAWVDGLEIWVLPNHNPDGTQHVFSVDSMWRKNRRNNGNGTFGVDPNRNYPFKWSACSGSSGDPASDTYRGPSAGSEQETSGGGSAGILALARQQRPVINLSYHTYSELVIVPYGCDGSYTPENQMFRDLSSTMGTRLVGDSGTSWYQPGTAPELLYAVDGEMNDWFYGELGSYGLTVEANTSGQGFQPDYATWRNSTVTRNRPGWQYLLDRLEGPGVSGHVLDACSGSPLQADVSLDEVVYTNGETPRTSEPTHGRFHFLTLPGTWTLRVAEPGYRGQVWPTEVAHGRTDRTVRLVPTGSFDVAAREVLVDDAAGDADGEADPGEQVGLFVRLLNTGDPLTGITATLSSADPLVTIVQGTATYPDLAAGATADGTGFVIQIDDGAPDGHVLSLSLDVSADDPLCTPGHPVELGVTTGFRSCPAIIEPLDVNPGWTIQNSGPNGWEFGPPAGNGGSTGPAFAPTGTNVYGTNLDGTYSDNANHFLTTGSYDLRGIRGAELRYWRWLHNEAGYDLASTEMSLDGGASWTQIWAGFGYGEGWQLERIDISSLADGQDDVRFRFRLRSDVGVVRPGFYVDDLSVCGESVPTSSGSVRYLEHVLDDSDPERGNGDGFVDVGETVGLQVKVRSSRNETSTDVEAFLTTTTPGVTIGTGYARFEEILAGGVGWSLAPHFTFRVEGAPCGTDIAFELDVRWAGGGRATSRFSVPIGHTEVANVLDDTFEVDQGWATGGTAVRGLWVRQDPWGVNDPSGVPIQPEDDHTQAPGVVCWVTGNPRPTGSFQPTQGDVDGGTAWLQSPLFDGSGARRLDLRYSRFFTRRFASTGDASSMRVLASNDGGAGWVEVERVDTDSPAWSARQVSLRDLLAPTSTMKVRIEVTETLAVGDTILEGLVDDVSIERESLACAPYTAPSHLAPNGIGSTLVLSPDGTHLRLDWTPPPVDATHHAASAYRVYRSSSPAAGFVVVSLPNAPFDVQRDDLLDPDSAYLLVVAENSGGTSGDEPLP